MKKMPWRIQFHVHVRDHELVTYNPCITVGAFDIGSRGIWAECSCGRTWSL